MLTPATIQATVTPTQEVNVKSYRLVTTRMRPGESYDFQSYDDTTARKFAQEHLYPGERVKALAEITGPTTVRVLAVDMIPVGAPRAYFHD